MRNGCRMMLDVALHALHPPNQSLCLYPAAADADAVTKRRGKKKERRSKLCIGTILQTGSAPV